MLTSRNDDLRWILATIVESGNRRFSGWTNCDELCFHGASFVLRDVFLASIFVAYVEPKLFFHFRAGKFSSGAPIVVASLRVARVLALLCLGRAHQCHEHCDNFLREIFVKFTANGSDEVIPGNNALVYLACLCGCPW